MMWRFLTVKDLCGRSHRRPWRRARGAGRCRVTVPESHEVRRWRWRQEDAAFDRRDHLYGQIHQLMYVLLAVMALLTGS